MAVTKPVMFSPLLDTEVQLNRPCQEDLIRKMIQNMNMLAELCPIGAVEAFAINIPGVSAPLTTNFQLCEGTEITEPTSPLRSVVPTSRFVPDTRLRYLRGANAGTTIGNELGGAATVNLAHSHGGATGAACFGINGEEGDEQSVTPQCHIHGISSNLNAAEPLEPQYAQMAFYLKIN